MTRIAPYGKALIGAVVAGLNVAYQALDNDTISGQEWIAIAIAVLTTGGVVFSIPNKDPEAQHQAESVQPPDPDALS